MVDIVSYLNDSDPSLISRYTPFMQVRDHFNAFIAEHPNGKMKMKDFREMMSKAGRDL